MTAVAISRAREVGLADKLGQLNLLQARASAKASDYVPVLLASRLGPIKQPPQALVDEGLLDEGGLTGKGRRVLATLETLSDLLDVPL